MTFPRDFDDPNFGKPEGPEHPVYVLFGCLVLSPLFFFLGWVIYLIVMGS